jgi:hypothetical protein
LFAPDSVKGETETPKGGVDAVYNGYKDRLDQVQGWANGVVGQPFQREAAHQPLEPNHV